MSVVNSAQLHIIKIEVAHGSDRHEISLYTPREPTVNDLLVELEKKTRVPISNIQIIYKGQKLHLIPDGALKNFGIFSGSRLLMVGERLSAAQDAIFRRILGINKDVGLVEKGIHEVSNEFGLVKTGSLERSMIKEYLPQMHQRVHGMKKDLETFARVLADLDHGSVDNQDVLRYRTETENKIKGNIQKCDTIIQEVASFIK